MVRTRSESMGVEKSSPSSNSSSKRRKGMLTARNPTILRKHVVSKEEEKRSEVEKGISSVKKSNKKQKKNEKKKKNNSKNKEEEVRENTTTNSIIQVGDTVNLSDLLFTNYRDYLITYNQNNRMVKAKDLAGKVIVLHFMSLTRLYHFDTWRVPVVNLRDIYSKLHPKGDFEIVFVARGDGDHVDLNHFPPLIGSNTRKCFREIFSMMPPCPAIPLSDQKSRQRLERIFGIHTPASSFIIDPRGVVLQSYATQLLIRYGAAGYPFTNERIQFLDSEDNLDRMQPFSVKKYLASPERDYLINNKGDQVPLHTLDDKVVGLYFCPCLDGLETTRMLEKVYKELSKNTEDFEIVLIYTHGWCEHEDTCGLIDEDSFLDEIKTMPWLALPFTDTDCNKKLQRIFQNPQDLEYPKPAARLIIIGPHGKFIEPLGTNILMHYGAPAYPFTLHSAVSLELERAKKVKPETFWDLDTIFTRNDGSQVRFFQFVGKRIIVLYQKPNWRWDYVKLEKLKARYFQMKGTDDEFEVIHILSDMRYYDRYKAPMPWLMLTPFDHYSNASRSMSAVFGGTGGLLAFDRDGSVVRLTTGPLLGDSKVFPFHHCGDMDNEVLLNVKKKIIFRLESVHED